MTTDFAESVYKNLAKVPKGRVTTYKELAESVKTKAYQAVGTAMKNNPYAPKIPCHRVVATDGTIGGFRGFKQGETIAIKIQMLLDEGIEFEGNRVKNFNKLLFKFN